jgi:amidophosphoribosyltransferase
MKITRPDKPRCHCGIFGVFAHPQASTITYYGLLALQHRGQEATGIVTRYYDPEKQRIRFNIYKGIGLVNDVFRKEDTLRETLKGNSSIGHNRYSTTGSSDNRANVQPFMVNYRSGHLAVSHNGNLTNYKMLRKKLSSEGTIFQTTSDSEIILHLMARSKEQDQIKQIQEALNTVDGAYSLVLLTDTMLVAARDPYGFRPLSLGRVDGVYVIASETCAFDIIGAEYIRDIAPGEILVIDDEAILTQKPKSFFVAKKVEQPRYCIFEYIYFSRPDSKIFGDSVDRIRRRLGKSLARESPIKNTSGDDKTIVISVPDSSNTATLGFVSESNKLGYDTKLEIGLIRSHYIGRTFIQPQQDTRELNVKMKFNTVKGVLKDRVVVIVDDSIVRGTTSKKLIRLIREAGPKEIHFRVTSPPIKYPCYYGMDFPNREELIANQCNGDIETIRKELGVDSLSYLSIEQLLESVPTANGEGYCTACFSGLYPITIDPVGTKDENDI